jgi:Uma2 family endonuclease
MSTTIAPPMTGLDAPPVPNRMTPEEFAEQNDGRYVEYLFGKVVEPPMPFSNHGKICIRAAVILTNFADEHDLGHVVGHDSWIKTPTADDPTKVMGPDIAFYTYGRLPKGDIPQGYLPATPELVMEVRSPSDRRKDILERVAAYLTNDVKTVLVFDPASKTATVYRNTGETKLATTDTLELPDILPGFSVPVANFFA